MPDYETLRVIWWLILGTLLIGFAVTDGFDLGVGIIFRFVGRNDEERRALLECIEPVWEGNQVWFVLGGGAVFAAWPLLYAASFSNLLHPFALLTGVVSLSMLVLHGCTYAAMKTGEPMAARAVTVARLAAVV